MMLRAMAQHERERRIIRRLRLGRATLLIFATLLAVTSVAAVLADRLFLPSAFQVDRIRLEGSFQHVDPEELKRAIVAAMDGNFFAFDLKKVEKVVVDIPWIYSAIVRRVWPGSIHVTIKEQQPVARWGERHWLNEDGQVIKLTPTSDLNDLVQLSGPPESSQSVLKRYRYWQLLLAESGLEIQHASLSQRRAWTLTLSPLTEEVGYTGRLNLSQFEVLLGSRQLDERLQRLMNSYRNSLKQKVADLVRVDLRYPNGLAVSRRLRNEIEINSNLGRKT